MKLGLSPLRRWTGHGTEYATKTTTYDDPFGQYWVTAMRTAFAERHHIWSLRQDKLSESSHPAGRDDGASAEPGD